MSAEDVLARHYEVADDRDGPFCNECKQDWPCDASGLAKATVALAQALSEERGRIEVPPGESEPFYSAESLARRRGGREVPATFPLDVDAFLAGLDSPNHSPESRRDWVNLFYRDMVRSAVGRLDEAWAAVEAVLPEGWAVEGVVRDVRSGDDDYGASAGLLGSFMATELWEAAHDLGIPLNFKQADALAAAISRKGRR